MESAECCSLRVFSSRFAFLCLFSSSANRASMAVVSNVSAQRSTMSNVSDGTGCEQEGQDPPVLAETSSWLHPLPGIPQAWTHGLETCDHSDLQNLDLGTLRQPPLNRSGGSGNRHLSSQSRDLLFKRCNLSSFSVAQFSCLVKRFLLLPDHIVKPFAYSACSHQLLIKIRKLTSPTGWRHNPGLDLTCSCITDTISCGSSAANTSKAAWSPFGSTVGGASMLEAAGGLAGAGVLLGLRNVGGPAGGFRLGFQHTIQHLSDVSFSLCTSLSMELGPSLRVRWMSTGSTSAANLASRPAPGNPTLATSPFSSHKLTERAPSICIATESATHDKPSIPANQVRGLTTSSPNTNRQAPHRQTPPTQSSRAPQDSSTKSWTKTQKLQVFLSPSFFSHADPCDHFCHRRCGLLRLAGKSPKRKVMRVESEETQAKDLNQEESEEISFVPSAISVPQKPLFRCDNQCSEKTLSFWQFASVVIKEGEDSYTPNLCQQCFHDSLVASRRRTSDKVCVASLGRWNAQLKRFQGTKGRLPPRSTKLWFPASPFPLLVPASTRIFLFPSSLSMKSH